MESESRASRIKIYDTIDRSAVKIHRRAFVSCSRVQACYFFPVSLQLVPKLSARNFPR